MTREESESNLKIINFFKFEYEGHIRTIKTSALVITVVVAYVLSYGFLKTENENSWISVLVMGTYLKLCFIFNYFYVAPGSIKSNISSRFIYFYTWQYIFVTISTTLMYWVFKTELLVLPEPITRLSFFCQITIILIINFLVYHAAWSNYSMLNTIQIESKSNFYQVKSLQKEVNIWQQQINPHFIGNALSNLNSLIRNGNSETAITYNAQITELFRDQMRFADLESISVEEEVNWVINYLEVEKKRVPYQFDYAIEFENADLNLQQIPTMLLQPLIENSLTHGFNNELNKKWLLGIRFEELNNNTIKITLEDNGMGKNSVKPKNKNSTSLTNIHKRIGLLNNIGKFEIEYDQYFSENGATSQLIVKLNN